MNKIKNTLFIIMILLTGLIWGFLGGIAFHDRVPPLPFTNERLPVLNQAYYLLRQNGLDEIPADPVLEYGMIRGMIQAYGDPHTYFLEPAQAELVSNSLHGSFGGIGARLGTDEDGYLVLFPYPDSPADQAGILEGDRLLQVEDRPVEPGFNMDQVLAQIRGPVGQEVRITVGSAPDYAPRVYQITRAEIAIPSVANYIHPDEPRLGVIEINLIAESTPTEIQTAVSGLIERGVTHFVLDLRNNGGGLLDSGIECARLFLSEGEVMRMQFNGKQVEVQRVEHPGPLADLPLVVLVNGNSASAAEIIAGALQANQRAQVIGTPTFGKNTIQLVFALRDNSTLNVTSARWWFEGLAFPQEDGRGLMPDILIEEDPNDPGILLHTARQVLFP
jgi:carboxyl-terminal processing protease